MNSFWINLYDNCKDRRYGAVFFGALAAFFGMIGVGAIFYQAICAFELQKFLLPAAVGAGLLPLAWIVRGIFQMRTRRQERLRFPPLSRDELRKARSKLRNGMKPVKRLATRKPDTYLKY